MKKLSLWEFLVLLFVYSLVSIGIFTLSSGGLSILFILPGTVLFFTVIFLLAGITSLVFYRRGIREIVISKKVLSLVAVAQILTIFLNYGDCGDSDGSYLFFQRFGGINPSACYLTTPTPSAPILVTQVAYFLFAVVFLVALIRTLWKGHLLVEKK